MILMDTGPLVALFDPADADHSLCHRVLETISEPLYTTEAVLTEVLHMLEPGSKGADGLKEFMLDEYVSLVPAEDGTLQKCFELMDKYKDLPMDFADATLVVLAEIFKTDKIFTLDFKDFRTYQVKKGHRHYPLYLVGSELLE